MNKKQGKLFVRNHSKAAVENVTFGCAPIFAFMNADKANIRKNTLNE